MCVPLLLVIEASDIKHDRHDNQSTPYAVMDFVRMEAIWVSFSLCSARLDSTQPHCSGDACSLFQLPESCLMEIALFAADAADRPSYTRIPDVEVDEGPLVAFLLGQAVTQPQESHNSFCIRCYHVLPATFSEFLLNVAVDEENSKFVELSLSSLKMISLLETLDRLGAVLQVLGPATVHLAIWRLQLLLPRPYCRTVQWP